MKKNTKHELICRKIGPKMDENTQYFADADLLVSDSILTDVENYKFATSSSV